MRLAAANFDDLWISLAEGPGFHDCASGTGLYAEQALRRLRERRRPTGEMLRAAARA